MTKMCLTSALPGERFVTGPFGGVGYIAKRPGHGAGMEKILQERALNRLAESKLRAQKRDTRKEALMNEHYRKFDELTVRASVGRLVELGMQEAENYFMVRQNKLRKLFLEDKSALVEEYTSKAQTSLDRMLAKEKLKAEEIVNSRIDADKVKVQQIYADRVMKNSEGFKEKLRFANMRNASESNREQIRIKENQRRMEQEEDKFWEEERRKVFTQKEREDGTEEKRRQLYESLDKQIKEEENRRKRQVCIEEVEEERNREIRKVWEDSITRRDEEAKRSRELHSKALIQQIESNRMRVEQNLRDDLAMEAIMAEDKRKKAEREAAAYKSNKLKAWNELVLFKESMVQYRKAVAAYEEENEGGIEETRNKMERKKWEAKKAIEMARRDLRIDCTEANKRMVKEKAKKPAELKSMDSKRLELLKRTKDTNDRLDVELARRTAMDRISFNKAQSKYMDALVRREKQEDEEMVQKMRQLNEENSHRVRKVLEGPVAEMAGKALHPFYKIVREQHKS